MTELATKQDLVAVRQDLQALEARLEAKIDTLTSRLTVHLGGLVAAGMGILALLGPLH
jgi:hypothetical protein